MIKEEVTRIIEELGLPVIYQRQGMANVELDKAQFPTAVLYCISDFEVDMKSGANREEANILLFFLDKSKLAEDGEYYDEIIHRMKQYGLVFCDKVVQSPEIGFTEDKVSIKSIFDKFDSTMGGVMIDTKVKELRGKCTPVL